MLKNDLELIVQYPEESSRAYRCRGFTGLRLAAPAYVVFDGADITDQGVANLLGNAFCQEILRYVGAEESQAMPCTGPAQVSCHAMNEKTCRKILVRPAATGGSAGAVSWPSPTAGREWLDRSTDSTWEVLPAMPTKTRVADYVPAQWRGINVCFWTRHPIEMIWSVMQRAGLAPEESRLFISYVRKDTTPIADQLFGALTEAGFDVFLDRCSVPVGVQFQERLMQDLCDKSMVVLLNSAGVPGSQWVQEEIAIVKTYRLGLLELQLPNVPDRPDIDEDFRVKLETKHLVSAGRNYSGGEKKLSKPQLKKVVERIKETHSRALHRRRYELIDNFAAALAVADKSADVLADGTFVLPSSGSGNGAVVGLTVRPPDLGDFCSLHQRGSVSSNRGGWLISPSPFFLADRQAQVSWLGEISNIQHANEAQIAQIASNL